jgi:hypothetical protein
MREEISRDENSNRVVIKVTEPNVRWTHLYLAELVRSGFFPADAVGERNADEGTGKALTVWFAGSATSVRTDIAGEHKIFRARAPQREFFARHRIQAGDQIAIEWLGGREYRVLPLGREQLVWTREEIILALDFYVRVGANIGGPVPGQTTAQIIDLSSLLRKLSAYPPERQNAKYRNPNGVYKKLMNLRAIQAGGEHGLTRYSQRDAAVWREFAEDLPRLQAEAEAIRMWLQEGAIKPATAAPVMADVEIEQQHTETYMVGPSDEPRPAERAEQKLVLRYRDYMTGKGIKVGRKKYVPAGEIRPIYSDAWVENRHALIEAKNSDNRDLLRQAIGQLYDYRRFHKSPVRLAVLLPYEPNPERLDLLRSAGIEAVWPHGPGFRDSAGGAFT